MLTEAPDDQDLTVEAVDASGTAPRSRWWIGPAGVFAAVEVFTLVLWMTLGRAQWFHFDEWDFIAGRSAGSVHDLFSPHNEHWSTIPILVYRSLFAVVGLHTYVPYQLIVVTLHVVAAALLFVVMRRAAVNPWVAVAAASLFALFGSGWFNIVMAFQIGFTGALVLGLVHLILADHDGTIDRRDWLGLLAGLAGLMMSGVAVTMVLVVGLAVLVRRGWRTALLHTVPLAVVYLTWFYAIGRSSYNADHLILDGIPGFVWRGMSGAYDAMGQVRGVGLALALVLAVGLPIAVLDRRREGRTVELAAPIALLAGSLAFMLITSTGRVDHAGAGADASRYVHLVAAMSLPAIAVAVDAFVRRLPWFLPVGIVLLLVGIPGNVRALADEQHAAKPVNDATRQMILSLPRDELAQQMPRDFRPEPRYAAWVSVGWLLDAEAQHRLPAPPPASANDAAANRLRLSFRPEPNSRPGSVCSRREGPVDVTLQRGDQLALRTAVTITPAGDPNVLPAPTQFGAGHWLEVLGDTGPVSIRGPKDANAVALSICTPRVPGVSTAG